MKKEMSNQKRLSGKTKTIIEDIQRIRGENQKRIESLSPSCPKDGLSSVYYGETGSFQRIAILYKCLQGDIFSWDFEKQTGRLISLPSQEGTPREAK